jgi:hypothetical protein
MQMNRLAYVVLILLLVLAAVSMSVVMADAQSQAPATAQTATSSAEPQKTPIPAGEADPDTRQAVEEPPPASGATTQPIKQFKPTEKIEADSAVSFPIDI